MRNCCHLIGRDVTDEEPAAGVARNAGSRIGTEGYCVAAGRELFSSGGKCLVLLKIRHTYVSVTTIGSAAADRTGQYGAQRVRRCSADRVLHE